jgi:hypothetical protein
MPQTTPAADPGLQGRAVTLNKLMPLTGQWVQGYYQCIVGVEEEQIEASSTPAAHLNSSMPLDSQGSLLRIKLAAAGRDELWTLPPCTNSQSGDIPRHDIANPVVTVLFLLHRKGVVQVRRNSYMPL